MSAETEFIERLLARRPLLARRYLDDPIVRMAVACGAASRQSDDAILEAALAATCEKADVLQAELVKHLERSIPSVVLCMCRES